MYRVLIVSALLLAQCSLGFSSEAFLPGGLVQGTPFDNRLASAGFFNIGTDKAFPAGSKEPWESFFWTAKSFRYVPDNGDFWQSPDQTESRHAGDCEDKALWLYSRLKAAGYENTYLVVGRRKDTAARFHVWVTLTDDSGNTYILDPAAEKRPWEIGRFADGYYLPLYAFNGTNRYRYVA